VKRKALLIGHNDASSPRLNGVNKDLYDIREFLLSDFGGAWEPDEILYFSRPSADQLRKRLSYEGYNCDYLVTAFAGHGAHDPQFGSYIQLSDDETFLVSELEHQALRQLVLVDACRAVLHERILPPFRRVAGIEVGGFPDMDYRKMCRAVYESKILRAEEGTITIQSCSIDENAGDTPHGGLFTQALVRHAWRWATSISNSSSVQKVLNAKIAFDTAQQSTWQIAYQQRRPQLPAINGDLFDGSIRQRFFPFAVA
jgi:hypothetical protein